MAKYAGERFKVILTGESSSIDLDCSRQGEEIAPCIDVIWDSKRGIPLKNDSVGSVYSDGLFPRADNLVFLFQELYRVCRKDARLTLVVPYYSSSRAFRHPLNRNFFTEGTFRYFSSDKWYGSDYGFNVDFRLIKIDFQYSRFGRFLPLKKYLRRYLANVVDCMKVELQVIK